MVSLRRKKFMVMAKGGQRRSARLLALEEQKHEEATHVMVPTEAAQARSNGKSSGRKRGRKVKEVYKAVADFWKEEQTPQEISTARTDGNSSMSPSTSRDPTERMIAYILDMLEVKDTHELFSMPDDLKAYDYAESLRKPGDFATLRQKHRDRMYATIEQFENDVYTVFGKAIDSNSQDSIPYKEAVSMREQAKQVFQSLRYNPTYSELELSAWHQEYFHYKKKAIRNQGNVGTSGSTARPECSLRPRIPSTRGRGRPRGSSSSPCGRRVSTESGQPKSCEGQQRYTYRPVSDSMDPLVRMVCGRPEQLVYNNNATSYKESLLHFIKDAGPVARTAVEQKCLEYAQRVQAQSMHGYWRPYTSNGNASFMPPFDSWSSHQILIADLTTSRAQKPSYHPPTHTRYYPSAPGTTDDVLDIDPMEGSECRLQTDELLTLFSLIGTPEFLKRSNSMASSSSQATNGDKGSSPVVFNTGNQAIPAAKSHFGGLSSRTPIEPQQAQRKSQQVFDMPFL